MARALPDFPWDVLTPYAQRAAAHPGGAVDLSVGTPVDPTPEVVRRALEASSDAPGYPLTAGTPALRQACAQWVQRRLGAEIPADAVLPTIGSKEFVAGLPALLGLGSQSCIVIPRVAYPTYAVGAAMVGARVVATDHPEEVADAELIWLNSPGNPTGAVLAPDHQARIVDQARSRGCLVISDECYIELGWESDPCSVLHPLVTGGDLSGVLALFSLSKRSNMAGYRFGFLAGDPQIIADLLAVRKHLGMMVPAPVQQAAIAALSDDQHVIEQRARYASRRALIRAALLHSGFAVDHSEAGLYLWATRGESCWQTVDWFADRGIVVTPGSFYGEGGEHHVRVALTCTDEHAVEFAARLRRVRDAE